MTAGDAALGAVVKDAKEQLRALPDGVTYGLLRYLNTDVDLDGLRSADRVQLSRAAGRGGGRASGDVWQICQDGWSVTGAAAAMPHAADAHRGTQRRHGRHRRRAPIAGRAGRGRPRH